MMPIIRLILQCTWIGAIIIAMIVSICLLITLGARYWWVGELLSQLQPQYTLALSACLPFIVWRFRRAGWLILFPLFFAFSTFAPLYFPPHPVRPATSQAVTALHYNLDNTLSNHTEAFAYLRKHPVDILSLQELTFADAARLPQELPGYDIAYAHPMTNSHGSAVLIASGSGIRVRSAGIIHLPDSSPRPLIELILDIHGHSVALLSLHVIRPVGEWNTAFQQTEFAAAAAWSRRQQAEGRAILIMGDFNATPWSTNFRRFQHDSQLLNSEQGFGPAPTWPASLPPIFMIPIDHCLHSHDIVIIDRLVGPFLGSDHAPLHIRFALSAIPVH